jgi:hypothetical protein
MKQITKQLLKSARIYNSTCLDARFKCVVEAKYKNKSDNQLISVETYGKTREQAYRNFYKLIGEIERGENVDSDISNCHFKSSYAN